jgi:hypothetical protein
MATDEPKRSPRELELEDRLADLLEGLEFWRQYKIGSAELTTLDEMLLRWIEHGTHA